MSATEAIWIDPLSYDYLADGPPYLPGMPKGKVASAAKAEVRAWVRQAHAQVGDDVLVAFQHCVAEYGGIPAAELAVLLACVRAEAMIHQAHHWQTRGSSYYGDHLLFERIYGEVNGFIDGLAERAVGAGHHDLVQPLVQIHQMAAFSKLFYGDAPVSPDAEHLPLLSLRALLKSTILLQLTYDALEAQGLLSNGIDNLLQDVADKQETLIYLLKQRTDVRGREMTTDKALLEFQRALMARRIAARFIQSMEHDTPEALKKYLKDHPGADKSKHTVKKPKEEKREEEESPEVKAEKFEAAKKKHEAAEADFKSDMAERTQDFSEKVNNIRSKLNRLEGDYKERVEKNKVVSEILNVAGSLVDKDAEEVPKLLAKLSRDWDDALSSNDKETKQLANDIENHQVTSGFGGVSTILLSAEMAAKNSYRDLDEAKKEMDKYRPKTAEWLKRRA